MMILPNVAAAFVNFFLYKEIFDSGYFFKKQE